MRNKFKIILLDGSVFKPKGKQMILMNTDGIILIGEHYEYSGWSLRRLSEVIPAYEVRFLPKQDEFGYNLVFNNS